MSQLPEVAVTEIPADAFLLDVREDDEWAAGHAPGAHHIVLGSLPAQFSEVPKDSTIACICKGGVRSAKAAEFLSNGGYTVVNVQGGMLAWERAGLEMVSESGSDPTVI